MKNNTQQYNSTLKDYFGVLFRYKTVIIITTLIMTISVYIGVSLSTPVFQARVLMIKEGTKTTDTEYYKTYRSPTSRLSEVEIIKSNPVIERTVQSLRLDNIPLDYEKNFSSRIKRLLIEHRVEKYEQELAELSDGAKRKKLYSNAVKRLKRNTGSHQLQDTNVFEVTVVDFSPTLAMSIANVLSRSYLIFDLEKQLSEIKLKYGEKYSISEQVKDKIEELSQYLDGRPLSDIEALGPGSVKIIEQAKGAELISKYNKSLILMLTFPFSLIVGSLLALGLDYIDYTIKTPKELEVFLNIPYLGCIPKRRSKYNLLSHQSNPTSTHTQHYQKLSNRIDLLLKDNHFKTIIMTDVESSKDNTALIANIGHCLSCIVGHNVLIVDANLRNSSLSNVLNIPNNPGLTDVIEGKVLLEDAIKDLGSNLNILTAGQSTIDPTKLLSSSNTLNLVKEVRGKYDVILIACADIKNFTDAIILSSVTDAFLLIFNEGKVSQHVAKVAIAPLEQKKVNLAGAILNNRNMSIPKVIYDLL